MADTPLYLPLQTKAKTSGDGSTDTFRIPFTLRRASDLRVLVWNTSTKLWDLQVAGTDYSVVDRSVVFVSASIPPNDTGPSGDGNIEMFRVTPTTDGGAGRASPVIPGKPSTIHEQVNSVALASQESVDRQYWPDICLYAVNFTTGVTTALVKQEQLDTSFLGLPVTHPCTSEYVSVISYHNDPTPASDWAFDFYIQYTSGSAAFTKVATCPVTFGGTQNVWFDGYHGKWQDPSTGVDTVVDLDPGQAFFLVLSGSSMDYVATRISFDRRLRTPHS